MNLYCLIMGILFGIIGIAFLMGKAPNWITAWKAMPKEEQETIRMDRLSKNAGCVFLAAGIIFALSGCFAAFKDSAFVWCMIIWLVLTGADVYYIGKSKRYLAE